MTQYKHLSQELIDSIKEKYKNQSTMQDIKDLFYELEDDLDMETDYITKGINDKIPDVILYGLDGTKELLSDFTSASTFGSNLENALSILDNILYWAKVNVN